LYNLSATFHLALELHILTTPPVAAREEIKMTKKIVGKSKSAGQLQGKKLAKVKTLMARVG
jgi:hypothetical protein